MPEVTEVAHLTTAAVSEVQKWADEVNRKVAAVAAERDAYKVKADLFDSLVSTVLAVEPHTNSASPQFAALVDQVRKVNQLKGVIGVVCDDLQTGPTLSVATASQVLAAGGRDPAPVAAGG